MSRELLALVAAVIQLAVQPGMHARQVIALEIVIHVRLPVTLHHVVTTLTESQLLQTKTLRLRRQFAQRRQQRLGCRVEIHENPIRPFFGANGTQAEIRK